MDELASTPMSLTTGSVQQACQEKPTNPEKAEPHLKCSDRVRETHRNGSSNSSSKLKQVNMWYSSKDKLIAS